MLLKVFCNNIHHKLFKYETESFLALTSVNADIEIISLDIF